MRLAVRGPVAILVLGFGLFNMGCSLDANIQSLSHSVPEILSKPTLTEVTPASEQNVRSDRNYQVQASITYQDTSQTEAVTARGYKVYTSVQGAILRE